MKVNINQNPLSISYQLPSISKDPDGRTIHGYQNRPDLHHADGWRDYVDPTYDASTHRLGELIYDEATDTVTRQVIAKTPEELEAESRAMVPYSITPGQGKIMLRRIGKREQVEQIVAQSGDGELQDWFEYALSWERENPHITSMANLLGMSERGLDEFFVLASQIN